ncbi:MAG: hypothetical protein HY731_13195, partial [Candidatus Tectomicrobia bacterium]|nr:hypothetical protein [Candidatus Tectomicrobia bacterium]
LMELTKIKLAIKALVELLDGAGIAPKEEFQMIYAQIFEEQAIAVGKQLYTELLDGVENREEIVEKVFREISGMFKEMGGSQL